MITAKALGVHIHGKTLISEVSFDFPPSALTAILGRNGAGKTTLLRCLTGELLPSVGAVFLCNQPLKQYSAQELARVRAVLSQHHSIAFDLSVKDVVGLGRLPHRGTPSANEDRAALMAVRQWFNLDSLWLQSYQTLSGGERQRVQLARAAAQLWRPHHDHVGQVLILDEPAAALDLVQQQLALRFAVQMAAQGATVIAVVHDPNQAIAADQVILLKDGRIMKAGAASRVLTAASLQACIGVQIEAVRRTDGSIVFAW